MHETDVYPDELCADIIRVIDQWRNGGMMLQGGIGSVCRAAVDSNRWNQDRIRMTSLDHR